MAMRTAMHQAGASALTELLQFRELNILSRCWVPRKCRAPITCARVDTTADFPPTVNSTSKTPPRVRRMQAVVGQDASFDKGRQQLKLHANLKVSTSPWNGTAETIGADIAGRAQQEIDKSLRLDLPAVAVKPAKGAGFSLRPRLN